MIYRGELDLIESGYIADRLGGANIANQLQCNVECVLQDTPEYAEMSDETREVFKQALNKAMTLGFDTGNTTGYTEAKEDFAEELPFYAVDHVSPVALERTLQPMHRLVARRLRWLEAQKAKTEAMK